MIYGCTLSNEMDLEGHILYLPCRIVKPFGDNGLKFLAQELAIVQ
jgi:hypothetical protein